MSFFVSPESFFILDLPSINALENLENSSFLKWIFSSESKKSQLKYIIHLGSAELVLSTEY